MDASNKFSSQVSGTLQTAEIQQLERLLGEKIRLFELLTRQMADKKTAVINGDLAALNKLDQEILKRNQAIQELERKRVALLSPYRLAQTPLKELVQTLAPRYHSRLLQLGHQLLRLAETVQLESTQHRQLLDLSLNWVNGTVQLIAMAIAPQGASYTESRTPQPKALLPVRSTVEHSA